MPDARPVCWSLCFASLALCSVLLAPAAGFAQTANPAPAAPHRPDAPHAPPKAAPVPPVHPSGAPPASSHPAVAGSKPTPVVNPRPAPTKQPAGHGKRPPQAAPAPVPAPAAPAETKPAASPEPAKGSVSGLPLPRFAALRSDEVNMRGGPGTRYPIEWVYKRRDLPVQIEREFEVWRLVRDEDGVKGWVHQATLTGRRSVVVIGDDRTLRRDADDGAAPVATLRPGVLGRIRTCRADAPWCEVQVGEYRGWLKRDGVWGTYPGEAVNP